MQVPRFVHANLYYYRKQRQSKRQRERQRKRKRKRKRRRYSILKGFLWHSYSRTAPMPRVLWFV